MQDTNEATSSSAVFSTSSMPDVVGGVETTTAASSENVSEPSTPSENVREPCEKFKGFVEDWVDTLDSVKKKSLALCLCYQLVTVFSFTELLHI